jgi:hypothetical protein
LEAVQIAAGGLVHAAHSAFHAGDHVEGFEVAVLLHQPVGGFGERVDILETIGDVGGGFYERQLQDGCFEFPVAFLTPFSGYYFSY